MRFEVNGDTMFVYDSAGNLIEKAPRQPAETYSRVVGYHRPMSFYNIGKKGEFKERKYFTESKAAPHLAA